MADFKLIKKDTLPETLAENATIIYDGQIWIGNSDNEPSPAKGYREIVLTYSATDSAFNVDPKKIQGDFGITSFAFEGTPTKPAIVFDIDYTSVAGASDKIVVFVNGRIDEGQMQSQITDNGSDKLKIFFPEPTTSGAPYDYKYTVRVYPS
jgi:hypothetical protein